MLLISFITIELKKKKKSSSMLTRTNMETEILGYLALRHIFGSKYIV